MHLYAREPKKALALLQQSRASGALPPVLLAALARAQAADGDVNAAKASYRQLLAGAPTQLEVRRALVELQLNNNGHRRGARGVAGGVEAVAGQSRHHDGHADH